MESVSLNVLVVEDDLVDFKSVERMLHGCEGPGFRLHRAGSMVEGKRMLAREKFDAVVLDLGLPDMSGMETVAQMYASAPELPIVVLSGQENMNMALGAVRAGAQDFLQKSRLDGERLAEKIRFAIERIHSGLQPPEEDSALSSRASLGATRIKEILIAYSSPTIRHYLNRLVSKFFNDAKVDEVSSAALAAKRLEGSFPDLLIVDLDLEGESGKHLLKDALTRGLPVSAPILAMCANLALDLAMEFSPWPNVILLRKPATPDEIQHALIQACVASE